MGAQARQNGLVDQLGGLNESIALVRKRAKLSEKGETELVTFPPRQSVLDLLAEFTEFFCHRTPSCPKASELHAWSPGDALIKGGMLRMMPYSLSVQ